MSEASDLTPLIIDKPTQRRLTETQKRAMIAAVAQGETKLSVAQRFNCHPNTVSNLCKDVAGLPVRSAKGLEAWRNQNDEASFEAVHASVSDRNDVHKAAGTGLAWLKGVGVLAGDNQINVTVATMVSAIPEDWRDRYVETPAEDAAEN